MKIKSELAILLGWLFSLDKTDALRRTHTALTRPLTLHQGEVTNDFHRLEIPKGPIAVYRFAAQVVEKDNNGKIIPVPTYDAYLHHHVVGSFLGDHHYQDQKDRWTPMKNKNMSRAVGFGAGTECRGTPQEFYFPYAFLTKPGEDAWVANVHIINTRKMTPQNAHKCLECPCTPENKLWTNKKMQWEKCNVELLNENNTACFEEYYIGGLRCCEDGVYCLSSTSVDAEQTPSTYYLQYTIEYDDIVHTNKPLYVASCCDATGSFEKSGNIEYDIPVCDEKLHPGCVHTLSTRQRIGGSADFPFAGGRPRASEKNREVELVYAVGHQHRGGLGISIYDDATGNLLCESVPKYGNGHVAGNENKYVIAMTTCTFDPPIRMKVDDVLRIVALYNNTVPHTGVMSLFYLALADVEPQKSAAVDGTPTITAISSGDNVPESYSLSQALLLLGGLSFTGFMVAAFALRSRRGEYVRIGRT